MTRRIVVVGAGVGGLTTAAVLARQGLDVTVLEAHAYPGGCAGTFYHQGYRFDAGATLAGGFYEGGPMDIVARAAGVADWNARPSVATMNVHLPDGTVVTRWADERRHTEHAARFGPAGEGFFAWQERTADAMWDLALRRPPWPPQSARELAGLVGDGIGWLGADVRRLSPTLALDALRPVAAHLAGAGDALRLFVDGQLLIAAQATSRRANALYGASALDLPRRGVVHLAGGMGGGAEALAAAVRAHGGRVRHRHEALAARRRGSGWVVETKRGAFEADALVLNLPPANIARLLGDDAPDRVADAPTWPEDGWGAFMVYVGLDDAALQPAAPGTASPLHHQVIACEPLAEGNTVFLSLSPDWDASRAPAGGRALTISTHTRLGPWWDLFQTDRVAYEARKAKYAERVLAAAEMALPGLRSAARLVKLGTPVTFQRFTRRERGWVGGFPQTSLFRAWAPRLAPGLWMVGDSVFPGQSTAAVALGGLRVAAAVLAALPTGSTWRARDVARRPSASADYVPSAVEVLRPQAAPGTREVESAP